MTGDAPRRTGIRGAASDISGHGGIIVIGISRRGLDHGAGKDRGKGSHEKQPSRSRGVGNIVNRRVRNRRLAVVAFAIPLSHRTGGCSLVGGLRAHLHIHRIVEACAKPLPCSAVRRMGITGMEHRSARRQYRQIPRALERKSRGVFMVWADGMASLHCNSNGYPHRGVKKQSIRRVCLSILA